MERIVSRVRICHRLHMLFSIRILAPRADLGATRQGNDEGRSTETNHGQQGALGVEWYEVV